MRMALLVGFLLCLLFTESYTRQASGTVRGAAVSVGQNDAAPSVAVRSLTAGRRIRITENRGQIADTDGNLRPDIRYHANAGGAQLFFTRTGISVVFARNVDRAGTSEATGRRPEPEAAPAENPDQESVSRSVEMYRMDMLFSGANPDAQIVADERLEGYTNYYFAHCPDGITFMPGHGRLTYRNIYDNIDFVFTTGVGRCKYEFVVHPGGKVEDIRIRYAGARELTFTEEYGLAITAAFGGVREEAPLTFQDKGKVIPSTFMLNGNEVGFIVGAYDASRDLVIDPWATYFGSDGGDSAGESAVTPSGYLFLQGDTESPNFPVTNGSTYIGDDDLVIARFSPDGIVLWSTYYGGSGDDNPGDVTVDASGSAWCVGGTWSANFPVTTGATHTGSDDVYLLKVTQSGTVALSSLFGGSDEDEARCVAMDPSGNILIGGYTESTDFPVTDGTTLTPDSDLFAMRVSPTASILWATMRGGTSFDIAIAIAGSHSSGDVAVVGVTASSDFPITTSSGFAGGREIIIVRWNNAGTVLWSTYHGGSADDVPEDAVMDANGNIVISGGTSSTDFPIVNGVPKAGSRDAFLVKMASSATVIWSTCFGNIQTNGGSGLEIDGAGNLFLCGGTDGTTAMPAEIPSNPGGGDLFIAKFSGLGVVQWTTRFGGTNLGGGAARDYALDLSLDAAGNIYISGQTQSIYDFPSTNGSTYAGGWGDLIVFQLAPDGLMYYGPPTPPVAPAALQATPLNPFSVALQWQDLSNNESRFVIERESGPGIWIVAASIPKNIVADTIDGLQPAVLYRFRIKAENMYGSSPHSNTAEGTTLPFLGPTALQALAISSDAIELSWTDNTLYELQYVIEQKLATGVWVFADSVTANTTYYIRVGLAPVSTITFRVKAVAGSEASVYSNEASATTLQYFAAPANLSATVLSQSECRLDWEDLSSGETGFEIEQQLEGGAWTLIQTTTENAISHTVTGLFSDTLYLFRVRAVGYNAASAWSNEATVSTRTKPGAPRNLSAVAVSHRAIDLAWERVSTNETGFELERKEGSGAWVMVRTPAQGTTTIRDDNLKESTPYTYRIRAINSLGESIWSNEANATTQSLPVPLKPIGLTATATSASIIRLTWVALLPQYQAGFELQESPTLNDADFRRIAPDAAANATSYDRAGLTANTTYYYRIRAFNASGASDWSSIASARTPAADPNLPGDPFNAQAASLGASEIRISWDMPSPSKEDGFEIEQSLTGNAGDFTRLSPNPAKGARDYTATGLQANTTYWYRVRASNTYGFSAWSNMTSATTQREPLSQALSTAMQAKEALYPGLENLIAAGDAEMTALRSLFGSYPLGYSEEPARTLIASWQNSYPDDQTRAAEALERYTFFEQALKSGFNDTQFTPPVEGAWEMSREASGASAMLTKDACALALAWAAQRSALGTENHYIDAAMEDLLLPVADGTQSLLALMGANDDDAVSSFAEEALRSKGAVSGLTLRMLLSVMNYWQERMAGRYYFPASGPAIQTFADRCEQLDIGDTRQSAIAKRDGFTLAVRDRTNALSLGYTQYAGICTGLDAAYSISQTLAPTAEIFLQRLTQLRPRLVDGMHKAITDADIPVERFLYLTSTADIPGLDPLPYSLLKVGNAIFHPEIPGSPHVASQGLTERRSVLQETDSGDMSSTMAIMSDPAIESDRTALIVLREKVVAGDAAYAAAEFDALRAGGREMTAAIARTERPLFGIAPAEMHRQSAMRDEYYRAIARSTLLRTRRTVLSVSLADYALAPTAPKQAALVAEIDSIIGPLDDVITGLEDLKSGQAGTLITLPALALTDADIVRDESAGPTRYRLRFAVTNTGGAFAASPVTELSILTEGVTALQQPLFTFADLAAASAVRDSLDIDIPSTTSVVAISAALRTGGSVFTDRRTLAVPPSTTRAEKVDALPASCLLHQNHPNPFRPVTTISFSLKQSTVVTVVVTDVLGREVARLCDDERRSAGTHSITFDARELTSGMYFYRLEAAGLVQTRKMLLMR